MTCQMIHMDPGPHGEGVETPCENEAVFMLDDVPCCAKCFYPGAVNDYETISRIVAAPASSSEREAAREGK